MNGGAGGADQAGPGQDNSGDPASPSEISRRLAGDDSSVRSGGRSRHGTSDVLGGLDGSEMAGDDTTTTMAPDPIPDAAVVPELPADFDQSAAPPESAPFDQTFDTLAPLAQAGHSDARPRNKPALWATAIAFGAILIVSAAWLWTRRDGFDPA